MSHPGLTAKQLAFAQEYVRNGGKATAAYRLAYGDKKNIKPSSVHVAACKVIKNAKVAAKVSELRALGAKQPKALAQREQQVLIDDARIIFESVRVALSDIRRLYNKDGTMKPPHEWDEDMAAAVQSVGIRELFGEGAGGRRQIGVVRKVKLWDKSAALERLMRQRGMFERDNQQQTPNAHLTDDELLTKLKMMCERLGIPVPLIRLPQRR